MSQTLLPLEVILIDDCSGDGTLDALQELQRRHGADWIRVIGLGQNLGAANARNAGWDAAKGGWIAFLDADDTWHPRKIEVQYRWMQDHPDTALTGHLSRRAAPAREQDGIGSEIRARPITPRMLLLSNRFVTPSVMLRREIGLRFCAGRRHMEDHLLWMEIVLSKMPVVRLEHVLCYTHKAAFGERGLSANMWNMERAELANYWMLGSRGIILRSIALGLCAYSLLKYCRRLMLKSRGRLPESV